jgi:hypothetical protein
MQRGMNTIRGRDRGSGLRVWVFNPKSKIQNPKFRISPAFTMAELLVAMMILLIILGITGAVYKSASDAIERTNSDVGINEDFSTLVRQIDTTMQNIVTDGYLVIYGYNIGADTNQHLAEKTKDGKIVFSSASTPNPLAQVRSDAICFFTTGNYQSLVDGVKANAGWMYLGHAGRITPASMGTAPFDANSATNPLAVNRWVLSRYLLLYTPNLTGNDYRNTSIGQEMQSIATTIIDDTLKSKTRDNFYSYWISNTMVGVPPRIDFTTGYTFPYTLPNCGSFKVEFAMPASFDSAGTGSQSAPEMNSSNQIAWRNALDLNPTGTFKGFGDGAKEINAGGNTTRGIVVFGPNDPWPMFVRFTLRKYDETLSGTSEDPETQAKHGGVTLQYVYKLPAKN